MEMELQNLETPKKISFFNRNNLKIIILMSVVLLLIGIAVFSNVYGKILRDKEAAIGSSNNALVTIQPNASGNFSSGTTVGLESEEPVLVLTDFFNSVLDDKRSDAEKHLSEYSSMEYLKDFMDEYLGKKGEVKIDIMQITYSPEKTFSYIAVEKSGVDMKVYYRFTMIKINSEWRVFRMEKI